MKFLEALDNLYQLKQKAAVWEDIIGFLSKYVDNDVQSAVSEIRSDDAGVVPQDIITAIVKGIQKEKLEPLEEAIERYTNLEVGNGEEKAKKASVTGTKKPAVRRKQRTASGRGGTSDKQPQQGD